MDNTNINNSNDRSLLTKRINMMKIIEKGAAEIIIIGLFIAILMSSCGSIRMGNYHAWETTYGPKNCTTNW